MTLFGSQPKLIHCPPLRSLAFLHPQRINSPGRPLEPALLASGTRSAFKFRARREFPKALMRIPYRSGILFLTALAAALPGPALARTISLNGDWNFLADPTRTLDVRQLSTAPNVRPTRVPSSWQPQFTDLRRSEERRVGK